MSSDTGCCCCGGRWLKSSRVVDDGAPYAALGSGEENELTSSPQGSGKSPGGYQPPNPPRLVKSRSADAVKIPVPSLKDFKLLRCIGKGGFSKVSIRNSLHSSRPG